MPISKDTSMSIALAHREIEAATKLLKEITEAIDRREVPDIRDAFGRQHGGLELGVPSGNSGHRLYNVPWALARPIIEAHISAQKTLIDVLSEKARIEMDAAPTPAEA
jgi:hypothetical protein